MAFVSSLRQTKTKGMPECSSQRLCGLEVLSKFVQSSKQKNNSKGKKKKSKRKEKNSKFVWSSKLKNNPK